MQQSGGHNEGLEAESRREAEANLRRRRRVCVGLGHDGLVGVEGHRCNGRPGLHDLCLARGSEREDGPQNAMERDGPQNARPAARGEGWKPLETLAHVLLRFGARWKPSPEP